MLVRTSSVFVSRWRRKPVTWHNSTSCEVLVMRLDWLGSRFSRAWLPWSLGKSLKSFFDIIFLSFCPACTFYSDFLVQCYICGITRCPRSQICVNLRRVGGSWTAHEIMFVAREIPAEHKDLIHDVSYDYHGRRMATCSSDQSVKVRISHYICKFPVRSANCHRLLSIGFSIIELLIDWLIDLLQSRVKRPKDNL